MPILSPVVLARAVRVLLTIMVEFDRVYPSGHAGGIRNGFDSFICSEVERRD